MIIISRKTLLVALFFFASQSFAQNLPVVISLAKEQKWNELASLLEDGFNPNAVYGDGTTALHWASYHNSNQATELLLASGADVNATTDLGVTALWLAAENGSVDIVRKLLASGADPRIQLLSGETTIMTAAQAGNGLSLIHI